MTTRIQRLPVLMIPGILSCAICAGDSEARAASPTVEYYLLKMPDGKANVLQGSDLHFGRLGKRDGLWLVCDRNSGGCANQVLFIAKDRLAAVRSGKPIVASEAIALSPPAGGWQAIATRHPGVRPDAMTELKRQFESTTAGADPRLDLEGITIGALTPGKASLRLYVVAEQPNSLVLELDVQDRGSGSRAVLTACFAYDEGDQARGGDSNDGLEGISWSGKPGEFYIVEEGTRPHSSSNSMLYFQRPRLMRCRLDKGRVIVEEPWSGQVTQALHDLQTGSTHTLNAVVCLDDRTLLADDRNGGWLFCVNVQTRRIRPWLNLYDPKLLNLRERLSEFPRLRHKPYVSIEGVARDDRGDLWMVDDPAMPEGFRESCLVRLRHPPPIGR